jgi:hypothetical protein
MWMLVGKNASIFLLNRKSATEHGAFSADSPENQAVGRRNTAYAEEERSSA